MVRALYLLMGRPVAAISPACTARPMVRGLDLLIGRPVAAILRPSNQNHFLRLKYTSIPTTTSAISSQTAG
jgi:hypothetical protein